MVGLSILTPRFITNLGCLNDSGCPHNLGSLGEQYLAELVKKLECTVRSFCVHFGGHSTAVFARIMCL